MVTDASRSNWTPKEISRLGTKPDAELAAILGRSVESVRLKRQKLGIDAPLQPAWTQEEIRLLGTKPDREVAKLARLRGFAGLAARKSLQIKPTTKKVFTTGLNWRACLKP